MNFIEKYQFPIGLLIIGTVFFIFGLISISISNEHFNEIEDFCYEKGMFLEKAVNGGIHRCTDKNGKVYIPTTIDIPDNPYVVRFNEP